LALALKIFSTKDDNNHKLHITKRRGQPNPGPKDSNMFRIGPSACPCWCMLHCQTDQTEPKQNQNRTKTEPKQIKKIKSNIKRQHQSNRVCNARPPSKKNR
jgi:hypothetical protein